MDGPSTSAAAEPEWRTYASELCLHHAGPLLVMASIILDDVDCASEIVAATLAAACRPVRHPRPDAADARTELARSVYRRCVGQIATIERFGPLPAHAPPRPVEAGPWLAALSANHRAVLALTLFGGHDLHQAAATLRMSTPQVVQHVRETIRYCTSGAELTGRPVRAI